MNLPDYATYAIALAVTAGVVWVCYPHFLLVLGINRYRNGVFGGPEDLEPDNKSERYQDCYQDLIQLGFEPLGLHWSMIGRTISTQAYVFGLPEVPCMAEIYSRSDNLYLVTGFEGNADLETTSVPTNEVRSKDFCLTSLPHAPVQVLLEDQAIKSRNWSGKAGGLCRLASSKRSRPSPARPAPARITTPGFADLPSDTCERF
jgi:hypothetical protein